MDEAREADAEEGEEQLTGIVKSYGHAKGYGFITSEAFEGDIFFQRAALPKDLIDDYDETFFKLDGQAVSFSLKIKENGKPQARKIQLVFVENEPVLGAVKSYNEQKGYGFLVSPLVEGDIFFPRKDVPPHLSGADLVGTKVRFVAIIANNGKQQARDLAFQESRFPQQWSPPAQELRYPSRGPTRAPGLPPRPPPPMPPMPPMPPPMPPPTPPLPVRQHMGVYMSAAQGGARQFPSSARPDLEEGSPMTGFVKSFNGRQGYGFINSERVGGDIYFKAEAGSLEAGMQVSFRLHYARDGKAQARDIMPQPDAGDTLVGTIKSFNGKTGYGFVEVAGQPQDIYFNRKSMPEDLKALQASELQGFEITFTLAVTQDGKPQVQEMLSSSPPAEHSGRPTFPPSRPAKRSAGRGQGDGGAPAKRPRPGAAPARGSVADAWTE